MLGRRTLLAILLSPLLTLSVSAPAHATSSAWDLNDTKSVDLRWVGVYRQNPGTVRVDITLWNPISRHMLECHGEDFCGTLTPLDRSRCDTAPE